MRSTKVEMGSHGRITRFQEILYSRPAVMRTTSSNAHPWLLIESRSFLLLGLVLIGPAKCLRLRGIGSLDARKATLCPVSKNLLMASRLNVVEDGNVGFHQGIRRWLLAARM